MGSLDNNIIKLAKESWSKRKLFIKITTVFAAIGMVVALLSPKSFVSNTVILPQNLSSQSSIGGNLSGLASLAGVNFGSKGESIVSPDLYPQVIGSITFKKRLLNSMVTSPISRTQVSLSTYFLDEYDPGVLSYVRSYTIGLPYTILSVFRGKPGDGNSIDMELPNDIETISSEEFDLFKILDEVMSLQVNKIDGVVTIGCKMPTALLSAELTRTVRNQLQDEVIKMKLDKLKEHAGFLEERYEERKLEFEQAQEELAVYTDSNINNKRATSLIERNRLESKYDLALSIYQELAKQRETHELKIKETTPIFTVIQPVSVPYRKSEPRRAYLVVVYMFIGVFLSLAYILFLIFKNRFLLIWKAQS